MNAPLAQVHHLAPADVRARLGSGEPLVVLDVREADERDYCRLPVPAPLEDLHVPTGQVLARLDEIRAASGRGTLLVYCHHGVRSEAVALALAARGITPVLNLEGGIDAWSREVDPSVPRY